MLFSLTLAAILLPSTLAFPWFNPKGVEALLNHPAARQEIERRLKEHATGRHGPDHIVYTRRQLGADLVNGATTILDGTVEAVVDATLGLIPTNMAVDGLKRFPEDDHPFQAPGATDQRGPCPGLNTLANHGYIPRNGIATIGEIIDGTQALFNMEPDLSALLSTGGALDGGDIVSQKMSIGGPDDRVGLLGGSLNAIFGTPSGIAGHGRFNEGDASATRDDFYLNGDNISFQPDLFQQMHQRALDTGNGTYNVDAIKEHFKRRYAASKAVNRQFYFNVPSAAVVMGAYYFIPGFMSNGTIGDGGIANEASITSFYGAQPDSAHAWDDPARTYTHVPERIPEAGWYRRRTAMSVLEAVNGLLDVYLYARPALGGSGADDSWVLGPADVPSSAQGLSCFLYNAIFANFPSELYATFAKPDNVLDFVVKLLHPGYSALGCQVNFPDASGANATSNDWYSWSERYVGKAKEEAVGSGWYEA